MVVERGLRSWIDANILKVYIYIDLTHEKQYIHNPKSHRSGELKSS